MNRRQEFINYFFSSVRQYRYALMKFKGPVNELPENSDFDIAIRKKHREELINLITACKYLAGIHIERKPYATFISVFFDDSSFLEIDLIHRFERKGLSYLEINEVLRKASEDKDGIRRATFYHSFEYVMLFHYINSSSIPSKYIAELDTMPAEQRSHIFGHICSKYKLNLNTLNEIIKPRKRIRDKIDLKIKSLISNKGLTVFFNKLDYYTYTILSTFKRKGVTITFSGVDGAGKSTILELVKSRLQTKYRQRTVVLRHRPSILPILSAWTKGRKVAEAQASTSLPRQGKNRNVISSLFRFIYYLTDYIIGQLYIYIKYTSRGYTVLYDRYYFDFIVDPKRSNIILPKGLLKWCYSFVFKPDVNVLLYAPTDEIVKRKNELSKSEIDSLNIAYKELFEELNNEKSHFLVLSNHNKEEVAERVIKEYISVAI